MDRPRNERRRRKAVCASIGAGALSLLLVAALTLPPVFHAAECLYQKLRYTSICTACGQQQTEVFYCLLGTELARTEEVLPLSTVTAISRKPESVCAHPTVLIGRTAFVLTKALEVERGSLGAPYGWRFDGVELGKTLKGFEKMRPAEVLARMDTVVRESGR